MVGPPHSNDTHLLGATNTIDWAFLEAMESVTWSEPDACISLCAQELSEWTTISSQTQSISPVASIESSERFSSPPTEICGSYGGVDWLQNIADSASQGSKSSFASRIPTIPTTPPEPTSSNMELDRYTIQLLARESMKSQRSQVPRHQCFEHGCNGRSFSSLGNYQRHLRERSGTLRIYQCTACGLRFTRSTARNLHVSQARCKGATFGA
jgi:hypothetical protein